jgi:hypothetical protein
MSPIRRARVQPRGVYPHTVPDDNVKDMTPEKILRDVHQFVQPGLFLMVSGVAFETGRLDATVIYNLYNLSGSKWAAAQHWWANSVLRL